MGLKKKTDSKAESRKGRVNETILTLEEEKGELIQTVQRLQAEFENYKRRTENEQTLFRARATEQLITELLPLIDNFSIALKNHQGDDDFAKGIEIIFAQLMDILKNHNVTKITTDGSFDPRLHEALLTVNDPKRGDGAIVDVMQEGYAMNDKVLRPAKVSVNKKAKEGTKHG